MGVTLKTLQQQLQRVIGREVKNTGKVINKSFENWRIFFFQFLLRVKTLSEDSLGFDYGYASCVALPYICALCVVGDRSCGEWSERPEK